MQKRNIVIINMYHPPDCQTEKFISPMNELRTKLIEIRNCCRIVEEKQNPKLRKATGALTHICSAQESLGGVSIGSNIVMGG